MLTGILPLMACVQPFAAKSDILWQIGVKYHRSSKQQKEERLKALKHCMTILTKLCY